MKKQTIVKRYLLFTFLFITSFTLTSRLISDDSANQTVTVLLKAQAGVVTGTLLGIDETGVILKSADGKIREIPAVKIEKVFDSDAKPMSLTGDSVDASDDSEDADLDTGHHHRHRHRRNNANLNEKYEVSPGMAHLGKFMIISGIVLTAGGVIMAVVGGSDYNSDNETFQNENDEEANGQYVSYETQQTTLNNMANDAELEDAGVIVACVGLADGITGIILNKVGSTVKPEYRDADSGLISIENKQISWNAPTLNLAQIRRPRITLLSATF